MPSAYTRALKLPLHSTLKGEYMYNVVLELSSSYHLNYDLEFPPISETSVLVDMARYLALPSKELYITILENIANYRGSRVRRRG